ncbi:hypothetical protein HDF10_000314 [Edaphobacter lichenicola]|uniref:Uncharacterized protein n=1 Tax=Tunturiibacter lichenicola TaxID=2051959 RepID=A0A7W8N1W0_9BACT|nr:hypothetical protein [Edaphobacter lichenicola]
MVCGLDSWFGRNLGQSHHGSLGQFNPSSLFVGWVISFGVGVRAGEYSA